MLPFCYTRIPKCLYDFIIAPKDVSPLLNNPKSKPCYEIQSSLILYSSNNELASI